MNIELAMSLYRKYEEDRVIQNLIAQANSRFILYNALEPEMNFPKYSKDLDARCLNIALTYLDLGWNIYIKQSKCINSQNKNISSHCIEKAAGILEHIYAFDSCQKIYKEYYSLLCALGYYVVSQYSKSFIVLKNYTCNTDIGKMINSFLIRDFVTLNNTISNIQFNKISVGDENITAFIYSKILSTAFNNILAYIYTGNLDFINVSKDILTDLIELANINDEPHMWWIFRFVYLTIDEITEASFWSILPTIISDHNDREKYIYANIYKSKPVFELFKSQRDSLQRSGEFTQGFVIGMPTSSGKTKVAEISILKTLSQDSQALCIYIAPFRSLANEIESSLSTILGVIGFKVTNLYGSAQVTQTDRNEIVDANIIIATPEKVKSIIRSNPDFENRIKLVIVDEGHLVGGQPRYITSELLIEELKSILRHTDGRLIILSAVLPNLSDFSKWISNEKDNIATSSWRPSAQRFGELSFFNNYVNLKWKGNPPSFNNKFIDSKLKKAARETTTGKKYPAKYFPEDKKEAVGATAVKMLTMGSVLIFVGRSNMVLSQGRIVSKLMDEMHITHKWKNRNDLKLVELTCEEAYGDNSEIFEFIKQGIICHSSKLPTDVRLSIERLMAHQSPKIIIATSTLGQGVNVGVSTVIISNVYLDGTTIVDVKDFWNIAGRAGRAFTDTEGKILFAIDRTKPDYSIRDQIQLMNMYFENSNIEKANSGLYFLLNRLLEIANECGINYDSLLQILAENNNVELEESEIRYLDNVQNLLDLLDDTLLALNVKYYSEDQMDSSRWLDDIFCTSLAYIQAIGNNHFNETRVMDLIKARNEGVKKLAGTPTHWKTLVSSSIPLKASLYIDEELDSLISIIHQYISSSQSFNDLMELIESFDVFISSIPLSFDSKLMDIILHFPIRNAWYGGKAIEIIMEINDKSDKICNQYYSFHFPWIINAISKKLLLLEKKEESRILEDLSLFSEIGVSDIMSAKIYLAGIKSRICAIELSSYINEDDLMQFSVENLLIELMNKQMSNEITLSEKTIQWLELIDINHREKGYQELTSMQLKLSHEVEEYDRLYCKQYKNKFYLCSWDYKIRILIKDKYHNRLEYLVDFLGVYFIKRGNGFWVLESENPYIKINN